jgi:hypothetical protein
MIVEPPIKYALCQFETALPMIPATRNPTGNEFIITATILARFPCAHASEIITVPIRRIPPAPAPVNNLTATRSWSVGTIAVQSTPIEHVQIDAKSAKRLPIRSASAPRMKAPTDQPIRNEAPAREPIVETSCFVAVPPDISAAITGRYVLKSDPEIPALTTLRTTMMYRIAR